MTIPWYYMWSDNYRFFHEILKDSMKEPEFTLKPIEIEQSRFDKELYQIEGKHFWEGSLIKVDSILECLEKESDESEPYILFTDIDIIVKPGVHSALKPYIDDEYDMVFLKEGSTYNIGFLLLRRSKVVIDFWRKIREMMLEKVHLDQAYVNENISSFTGKYTLFHHQLFTCSNTWNQMAPFVVLQVLCSCMGKEFNMAEKIFSTAQIMNVEPYMQYVKEDIIPYIYRFQEIIYKSHKHA
jgi:hypothetical protein